jgi:predicted nucleic acid-binding protein
MNTFVLDTSVAVAWYLDEAFSAAARGWQERLLAGKVRLLVPSLHYLEVANVLRTLTIRGQLSTELAADIYGLHLDAPIETADTERNVLLTTALDYGSTAYDAAFIALAVAFDVPIITAERTTTGWVTKLGRLVEPSNSHYGHTMIAEQAKA